MIGLPQEPTSRVRNLNLDPNGAHLQEDLLQKVILLCNFNVVIDENVHCVHISHNSEIFHNSVE